MPARKRHDPTSRPADGRRSSDRLIGADPTRHYVYANPNDVETGVECYQALGYEIERYRKDGPRPAVGKTLSEGSQVTSKGQVLMSCPIEAKQERDEFGDGNGGMGQSYIDGIDRRILKEGNVPDGFRGRGRMRVNVDPATTSPPTIEHGA